ncbi:MAG: hypothetical protein L6282_14185 [Candidatus Methanoperedenaceae archaeon]|nr:hypothetical protein [Candidatus Methanoperedenaceae archaeon]
MFINAIWTYFINKYGEKDEKKLNLVLDLCNRVSKLNVKYADNLSIQYFIENEPLTRNVEKKHLLNENIILTIEKNQDKILSHILIEISNESFFEDDEWPLIARTFFDKNEVFTREILETEYGINTYLDYNNYIGTLKTAPIENTTKDKLSDSKPLEAKPLEGKPPESKPPESKPPESKPPEGKPPEGKPPEGKITAREKIWQEQNKRDSEPSKWVKSSYNHHCQVCLSKENPKTLTNDTSYAGYEKNKKSIIEAHHIKQVVRDEGDDDVGNLLSLCKHHHDLLDPLRLDDFVSILNDVDDKEILWPNGEISNWKILTLDSRFLENNKVLQIVIFQEHLKQLHKYMESLLGLSGLGS